jgi:hypothetical protein
MKRSHLAWTSAVLAGSVAGVSLAAEQLYGITFIDGARVASLVSIDTATGATAPILTIGIPSPYVPETMAYHAASGQFVIVLSGPDYHDDFALMRLNPYSGWTTIAPVSGFPPEEQKLHGIEYCADDESLLITFGSTGTHLENRLACVSLDGEALAMTPDLGVGDIDYLAWPDANENVVLFDPNKDLFPRLLSLADPFGSPIFSVYADPPYTKNLGDAAISTTDLSLYTIRYDGSGGSLEKLVGNSYVNVGPFGASEQVVGIAFASLTCLGDFNGDGAVDAADLAILLGAWGSSGADLDGSATTDATDLAILLGAWGSCTPEDPPEDS